MDGRHQRRQLVPLEQPDLGIPAATPPRPGDGSGARLQFHSPSTAVSSSKRVLGIVGFALIAFHLVGGGPYGLELSASYAGPGPCFLAFVLLPLVWSLPQALVTAELATLLPSNGGYVRWCTAAFGDLGGWIIGVNGGVGSVVDLALYPALLVAYAEAAFGAAPLSATARFAARLAVVLTGSAVNMRGIVDVSNFSGAIVAAVAAPFAIALAVRARDVWEGGWAWTSVNPHPRWSLWLASMLWAHSGWDSCGSFAGEVASPGKTYVRGSLLTMAFVFLTYAPPLLLAAQTTQRAAGEWTNGALQEACAGASPLLGAAASAGAVLSQLAMFTSGLSASSRAVWALAGGSRGGGGGATVAHLPRALAAEWGEAGVPGSSIAAHAAVVGVLSVLPFEALIQANSALGAARILLEAASFLRLRATAPTAARPFRVPGGAAGALVVAAPIFVVALLVAVLTDRAVWLGVLALQAAALAVFFARAAEDARRAHGWWPRGKWNLATDADRRFAVAGAKSPIDDAVTSAARAAFAISAATEDGSGTFEAGRRRRPLTAVNASSADGDGGAADAHSGSSADI